MQPQSLDAAAAEARNEGLWEVALLKHSLHAHTAAAAVSISASLIEGGVQATATLMPQSTQSAYKSACCVCLCFVTLYGTALCAQRHCSSHTWH